MTEPRQALLKALEQQLQSQCPTLLAIHTRILPSPSLHSAHQNGSVPNTQQLSEQTPAQSSEQTPAQSSEQIPFVWTGLPTHIAQYSEHTVPHYWAPQQDILQLEMILATDHVQHKAEILETLADWREEHRLWVEPVFLTQNEASLIQRIDATPETQPLQQLEQAKQRGLSFARQFTLAALDEVTRMLRLLERVFPSKGMHAYWTAQELNALFVRIVQWSAALQGRNFAMTPDDWSWFEQTCGTELFPKELKTLPLQLRAFTNRHAALYAFPSETFAEHEVEIEMILDPLWQTLSMLKRYARQTLVEERERQQYMRRKKIALITAALAVPVAAFALFLWLRPPYFKAMAKAPKGPIGYLVGTFYRGENFNQQLFERKERAVNFSTHGSPHRGIPNDRFSARWRGALHAPKHGQYTLCLRMDDGARLFLHNKMLVNEWRIGGSRMRCAKARLQQGWHPVVLEFFERGGNAEMRFLWNTPSYSKAPRVVPSKRLRPMP
ncbi:MAG: PA14 domain-containing protein [Myxococcota bacterium]